MQTYVMKLEHAARTSDEPPQAGAAASAAVDAGYAEAEARVAKAQAEVERLQRDLERQRNEIKALVQNQKIGGRLADAETPKSSACVVC